MQAVAKRRTSKTQAEYISKIGPFIDPKLLICVEAARYRLLRTAYCPDRLVKIMPRQRKYHHSNDLVQAICHAETNASLSTSQEFRESGVMSKKLLQALSGGGGAHKKRNGPHMDGNEVGQTYRRNAIADFTTQRKI